MSFDKTPKTWFGNGYSLGSSAISLTTATHAGTTIGTVTAVADTDVLTTSVAHNLKVNDIVQFSTTDTLPAGLSVSTDYYVLTVPDSTTLTVSASKGGTVIDITDTGTGTHTATQNGLLAQLTDVEANATTGDIREIMFALCDKMWTDWNNTASADRPTQMYLSKSSSINPTTGVTTHSFGFRFTTVTVTENVAEE